MSDPPPDQHTPGSDGDNPAAHQIGRVATTFETYARQDEAAQGKATKHSRKVRWWTRFATFAALAYTIITAFIFIANIRSVQETRRATHAASRQADITSDTAQRQLRAYVGPVFRSFRLTDKARDCDQSSPPDRTFPEIRFCYWVKNYGLTPARIPHECLRIIDASGMMSGSLNEVKNQIKEMALAACVKSSLPTASTVWPGEERLVVAQDRLDQAQITAIALTGRDGLLFVRITYYDVFTDFHTTDLCRHITDYGHIFSACRIEGQQDD